MSPSRQRQLFVIGFFRSGTSLLYSFLNLHPQIKLLYEADLLGNPLVAASSMAGIKWWERLDFYNTCLHRHNLQPHPSWNHIRTARDAAQILYEQYAGPDRLYIGEKSPSYYNCVPQLAKQFPNARFIVIWRDPQDVIASIGSASRKIHFFRSQSLPLRSLLGFEQMQEDTLRLRAAGTPVFDFCYEDLVENTEVVLRATCHFLELSFEPRMLDLGQADASMYPPGEHHHKAKSGELKREAAPGSSRERNLPPKTARYYARWKSKFQNKLATKRYWLDQAGEEPGFWEASFDQLDGAIKRFYTEQFIPVVYGLLPVSWLSAYRRARKPLNVPERPSDRALKISVVTPSYKQLPWLKLCIASVADQRGVEVEHIVQDAQSGPELEEWVRQHPKVRLHVEADSGMYDAINRGFARATGDIVCWLNSDEQYLEGALAKVAEFFVAHPEIDVLFGDALLIDNTGMLLSYRKTIFPNIGHIKLAHLNVLSCATFVRRSVLERGYYLDTRWRAIADAVWIVDLLKARIPMGLLNEPLAVFTITDKNLGQSSLALAETVRWQQQTSSRITWFRFIFVLWHRLNKLVHGAYLPRSVTAHFYILQDLGKRTTRSVSFLGFKWPHRL